MTETGQFFKEIRQTTEQMLEDARRELGAHAVVFYPSGETLDGLVSPLSKGLAQPKRFKTLLPGLEPLMQQVARSRTPVFANGGEGLVEVLGPLVETEGIKSLAGFPAVAANGEVLGVLFIFYRASRAFSSEQTEDMSAEASRIAALILDAHARQAAIALDNANLNSDVNKRLKALLDFARATSAAVGRNESEILDLIHQYTRRVMDTDNLYVALYDETTDTVRFPLAFVNGKRVDTDNTKGWQPRKAGQDKTEEIIRRQRPLLHLTKTESEAWYTQPGRQEATGGPLWASWLGLPMMIGANVLGVIATYHRTREHAYDTEDLETLQILANQAAIALHNARLFYDVSERQKVLIDFARAVTSAIDDGEDAILKSAYEHAVRVMDTDNLYVSLYDEATDTARFPLAFENGKRQKWPSRRATKGRTEHVLRTREPLLLSTESEQREWCEKWGDRTLEAERQKTWKSWLGVPLIVGDKVLGVIGTHHATREHAYDQDDLNILQALAYQTAVALESAGSYKAAERRRQHLETVSQVMRTIGRQVELQPCLESILDAVLRLCKAQYATIQFIEGDELIIAADRVPAGVCKKPEGNRVQIGTCFTGTTAKENRTIRFGDVTECEFYQDYVADTESEMATPLLDGDKVIGVLNVESKQKDAFSAEDEALFTLIAEQVVVAIQNARRFDRQKELQQRLAEEQARNVALVRAATASKMAAHLAHRISNLAGTIPARAAQISEILDKSAPNYDRIVRYLKAISTDVTALLAASRQGLDQGLTEEAGEYAAEGRLEEVDVAVLLSTAIGRIGLPPGISIDNRRCLETLKVLVPGDLIVETFENLIRNGVEAIEEAGRGGIVTLSCQEFTDDTGEYVRVDIHDNGCGISPENMSRVGTPGFTTKPRASGFAIWRAKALMESLEGRLTISSDPGKGTTVSILLPAQKKARG